MGLLLKYTVLSINHGATFGSPNRILICNPVYFLMSSQPTTVANTEKGMGKEIKRYNQGPEQEPPV